MKNKSGYGFADNDAALERRDPLNEEIKLGTFTHQLSGFPARRDQHCNHAGNLSVTDHLKAE